MKPPPPILYMIAPAQTALNLLMFDYHLRLHEKLGQLSGMLIRALNSCVLCTSTCLLHVDSAGIPLREEGARISVHHGCDPACLWCMRQIVTPWM